MQEHFRLWRLRRLGSGITPACAGTFLYRLVFVIILRGSPLRVQEHWDFSIQVATGGRITPACAGTFWPVRCFHPARRDHPCVCRNIIRSFAHLPLS